MISLSGLVSLVVTLIVVGLVVWLLTFLVDYCKTPEPFNRVAKVAIMLVAVLFVIGCLLQMTGGPMVFRP